MFHVPTVEFTLWKILMINLKNGCKKFVKSVTILVFK